MKHYLQTLQKDQETSLAVVGDFIHLHKATGEILIHVGNDDEIVLETGATYRADKSFQNIRVLNKFDGINVIDLIIGEGKYTPTLKIGGTIETSIKSGSGHLYKTLEIEGKKKLLDFNKDRLFFSIENKSSSIIKIGGVDVLKTFIEIQPNQKYSDQFSPTLEIWAIGTGKISIASKYKTQQDVIPVSALTFNGETLTFNNQTLEF